jgi:hypothetical protein
MALEADKVLVGITGKVYVGPTSTAAPTAHDTVLNIAFEELGYTSSEGVAFSIDRSTAQVRAWQNGDLVREVVTDATVTYTFTLLETNTAAIELYFGSAMTDGKIELNPSATGGRQSFVIDVVDGAEVIRHYIPAGEVTSVEAQTFANGEAISYGVTVTAFASGDRTVDIWHSNFVPLVVATIDTALPTAVAVGGIVALVGTGFSTAVSVTVGGVNAPVFSVASDTRMYVTMPAGDVGSAAIIVTNAAGASSAKAYTRGA